MRESYKEHVEDPEQIKRRKRQEKIERWRFKRLYDQLLQKRQTEQIRDDRSWDWIKKENLKKETEGLIMAAQDQALRTTAVKQDVSPLR